MIIFTNIIMLFFSIVGEWTRLYKVNPCAADPHGKLQGMTECPNTCYVDECDLVASSCKQWVVVMQVVSPG